MSWQQNVQQAAQRPMDETRQRRYQSESVIQQQQRQHRSATERRDTALAASGMAGFDASAGSVPYLYPPEWQQQQQQGRPQQSPHQSPMWRHQLQQQQMWQQQQLQQQYQQGQGPPTQQTTTHAAASAHFQQQRQGGSSYGNSGNRPYSRAGVSPVSRAWEEDDDVRSRSGYVSSRVGYSDTTRTHPVSYGRHHSDSRNVQHEDDYWGQQQQQQQQLLLVEEEQQQRSVVQEVEEQCMQSLQSSLRVAAETNEISQSTAVKLEEQSEQLRGIRDTTVEIQENLETSEYLLKGMKSWWGAFAQLFTSPPAGAKKNGSEAASGDNTHRRQQHRQQQPAATAAASSCSRSHSGSGRFAEAAGSGTASGGLSCDGLGERRQQQQQKRLVVGGTSQRVAGGFSASSDFDMRLEQDLQKLSDMLGEMHERAVAINSNLKQQNGMLGEIEKNVDVNQSSIAQQKKVLREIMRK